MGYRLRTNLAFVLSLMVGTALGPQIKCLPLASFVLSVKMASIGWLLLGRYDPGAECPVNTKSFLIKHPKCAPGGFTLAQNS